MALPAGSRWLRAKPPDTSMMSPRLPTPSISLRRRTFMSAPTIHFELFHDRLPHLTVAGSGDLHDLFDLRDHRLARSIVGHRGRRGVPRQRTLLIAAAASTGTA